MRTLVRLAATAVVVLLASFGVVGAASAEGDQTPDPSSACAQRSTGYAPTGVCELKVQVAATCEANIPALEYSLQALGTPNTTATVTFVNPGGADVVLTDQPLSGSILWPGAAVGSDGRGSDWPGWKEAPDGSWVTDPSDAWLAGTVDVHFEVNPEATVSVVYPAATTQCGPTSVVLAADDPELAATGSNAGLMLAVAGGLVGLGLVLLGARAVVRRRHAAA
jgi:hypothetical protein